MKKIKLILISIFVFTMAVGASCVKEKNCSNCITGRWVYLEKSYKMDERKIVAHFYPDESMNSVMRFEGKIPKKFQSTDTMSVCLTHKDLGLSLHFEIGVFELSCIEELK